MFKRSSRLNPVLEVKRDGCLAAEKEIRDNLLESYRLSIAKTKNLHANLLFTTEYGYLILKDVCRLVTFVDPNINNINWHDLAAKLGYTDVDIKCINNLRGNVYDPTELVLKYYASKNKEGSVGDILEALLDLGFLPALREAQKHINEFLIEVEDGKLDVIEAPRDGTDVGKNNFLKAGNFKPCIPAIFDSIPCKKKVVEKNDFNVGQEIERFQTSAPQPSSIQKQNKKYCKYVMLSFANDGYATALKIASVLRSTTNKKGFPIGVLMLCENDDIIQGNAGQVIPDLLSKMDYIIPVLTEGYFSALKHPNPQARLLDERYIQFIHDIFISKYLHSNCLNLQVRSVIPSQDVNAIYNKQEFIHNSIFNAWKSDDEITVLAKNMLKSRRSKTAL